MWSKWFACWSYWWVNSVSVHFAGQNFPCKVSQHYLNSKVFLYHFQEEVWAYILTRHLLQKPIKIGFLFIGDVIHLNSHLSFLIWVRRIPIHTFCLYSKRELSSLSSSLLIIAWQYVKFKMPGLEWFWVHCCWPVWGHVSIFKVTWMVMYYKKAGRLVLAVPCEFTYHAVGWKYWFIEPARLKKNSNSKLLHFNLYVKICKLFLTDMTFLLLFFFFNCLYSQNFEVMRVHYLVYFCFNVFEENN